MQEDTLTLSGEFYPVGNRVFLLLLKCIVINPRARYVMKIEVRNDYHSETKVTFVQFSFICPAQTFISRK